MNIILIITGFFSLLTSMGEIIESSDSRVFFLENLLPTLNKETKNKASMLKIMCLAIFILLPEVYLGPY